MGILSEAFASHEASSLSAASSGASSANAASGASSYGGAAVTAGVISGLTQIATGFINAGRVKQTAKFNAAMAEIEGRMAKVPARLEIAKIRKASNSMFSKQRALYAKAGVRLEGSPSEVMLESLKEGEVDAIITGLNAEYFGMQKSAEAAIYRIEGQGAINDQITSSFASILNMGTKLATRG